MQDLTRVMSKDFDLGKEIRKKGKKRAREDVVDDGEEGEERQRPRKEANRKRSKVSVEEVVDDGEEAFMDQLRGESMAGVPNDPIPRRKKIQKIEAWFATFPTKLEKLRENSDLESMSEVELDSLLLEIKQIMGSTGGGAIGEMLPLAGLTVYEGVMVACGVNVQGITQLAYDANFSQACKEVMLEYSDMTYIPPHYRALLILGNATWHLHQKNSEQIASKGGGQQPNTESAQGGRNMKPEDIEIMEAGKNYAAGKNSKN